MTIKAALIPVDRKLFHAMVANFTNFEIFVLMSTFTLG